MASRIINFCTPSPTRLQEQFFAQVDKLGFRDWGIYLQVAAPHDFWPSTTSPQAAMDQAEAAYQRALEECPYPDLVRGVMYDLEPEADDRPSWLSQKMQVGYKDFDIAMITSVIRRLKDIQDKPVGMYSVPRIKGINRVSLDQMRVMASSTPIFDDADWAMEHLYPSGGPIENRIITDANRSDHRDRVVHGYEVIKVLARGKKVIPTFWPRYITDNLAYFTEYFSFLDETDADEVLIWTNPHTEHMLRVFGDEFEEASPALCKWLGKNVANVGGRAEKRGPL